MEHAHTHYKILNSHSVIFFIFVMSIGFFEETMFNLFTLKACFFLILTIGISHGALDNFKGKKLLKIYKFKNSLIFYIGYILIALVIILLWVLIPTVTLLLFLFVTSYHFGKEDSEILEFKRSMLSQLIYLLKGSLVILAPLYFNFNETINIFEILNFDKDILKFLNNNGTIEILFYLSLISNIYFLVEDLRYNYGFIFADTLAIIFLNHLYSPLIAFTLYFCFSHSIKHSISLIAMLDKRNFLKGTKIFIKKALPLTLITAILFLFSVNFLTNYYETSNAILKVIFIGLASLTFPHILLEYLIEKNEQK